jgi:uncharacterized protein YyaL (SSP411 family)
LKIPVDDLRTSLAVSRKKLFEVRGKRVWPGLDDKILVSWNGLMIDAMASAAGVLHEPRYLRAAQQAADFLLTKLRRDDGRLLHSYRQGQAKFDAYLDDYACLANALVSLYEADFNTRWVDESARLADVMLARFADAEAGGFFYTADDHEQLIARNKDFLDQSVPSGNAMAATALVRLAKLTGRGDLLDAAESTLRAALGVMQQAPTAAGQLLIALDAYLGPMYEIAILGDTAASPTQQVLADLYRRYAPNKVVGCRKDAARGSDNLSALFAGKSPGKQSPTIFVCRDFACEVPVDGVAAAIDAWQRLEKPPAK